MNTITTANSVHHEPKRPNLAVLKIPTLRTGNDAQRAAELEQYIDEAESGLRSMLKVGFFLECLAADLKHGQLGPWVEAHCKRKWRTVRRWKEVAAGLADTLHISLKKRLSYKLHEVLSLPAAKVPEAIKPIREKLDAEIEGKTFNQLFVEFKQVDEDDPGKPKRGRLKGSSGLTKEQREAAAARAEKQRLEELELTTKDNIQWLVDNADAKNFGALETKTVDKLIDACDTAVAFLRRLKQSRAGKQP